MFVSYFSELTTLCFQNIPKGDWFCPTCKPKEKKTPAKKPRKVFDDDDDDGLDNILEADDQ